VVTALRRKYAELLGLEDAEGAAHVGAALLIFAPEENLSAIAPVRPYKAERERWLPTVLTILRTAERPMRAREIARRVMRAQGLEPDHKRVVSIACGLQITLGRLAEEGLVKVTGKPRRWALTPQG
jgi:hypothetical protein